MSRIEVTLITLIIGVLFMVAFRFRPHREHSPFSLFGVAPGMSLAELRNVLGTRHGTVSCRPEFDGYQYCVLKYSPDPGFVVALVDKSNRVIVVHAMTVSGLEGIHVQADSAHAAWSGIAAGASVPPLVEIGDTGAVRWTSGDRRWTAEMHFNGMHDPDLPTQLLLVDTKGVATLAEQSDTVAAEAKRSGWLPPTAEEAAAAMELHRANRRSDFGSMATTLSTLGDFETAHWNAHHAYTDNIAELPGLFIVGATNLEILSATDSGWTAKATHPGFPNSSCIAMGGRVPTIDWPVTIGGRTMTTAEGVTCDPLPVSP